MASSSSSSKEFKQFDVVSRAINDNFFNDSHTKTRPSPALQKKIMQEWRILENHLPDSIFVRVSDTNILFLRAAIIGAAATPYHDAVFFFDLSFPDDYPAHPPRLHFHSHGLRLNPNLYASGDVCLSLLNTWSGKASERWNPNQSTVLQVLLSIQALVLNSKPYFNEPGIVIYGNWERNSRAYNENAFLLTWKTAVYLLRSPPECFKGFVVGHFSRRAASVLGACWAYAEGRVRVGEWNVGGTAEFGKGSVSRKFRVSLKAVYKDLVAAFKAKGISVEGFAEVLEVETTASGDGILKRFVEKMKEMLGLKKKEGEAKEEEEEKKKKKKTKKNAGLMGWNGNGVV